MPDEGEGHSELEPILLNEMSVSLLETRISSYHSSGEIAGGASGDEQTYCGQVKMSITNKDLNSYSK